MHMTWNFHQDRSKCLSIWDETIPNHQFHGSVRPLNPHSITDRGKIFTGLMAQINNEWWACCVYQNDSHLSPINMLGPFFPQRKVCSCAPLFFCTLQGGDTGRLQILCRCASITPLASATALNQLSERTYFFAIFNFNQKRNFLPSKAIL